MTVKSTTLNVPPTTQMALAKVGLKIVSMACVLVVDGKAFAITPNTLHLLLELSNGMKPY